MPEEPPPPPAEPSPAAPPQDSGEEKQQSVFQCEEEENQLSIPSADEPATEGLDRLEVESLIPVAPRPQSDDEGEKRSARVEEKALGDEEKTKPVEKQEEEEGDDKVEERAPLAEREENGSSLKENEEEQMVPIDVVIEKKDDVPCMIEESGEETPSVAEVKEEVQSLREDEEEQKAPILEAAASDEVMQDEKKNLDVDGALGAEESKRESPHLAEDEVLTERDKEISPSEGGLEVKDEEVKCGVSDEIMQENVEEKLLEVIGPQCAEQPSPHLAEDEVSMERDKEISPLDGGLELNDGKVTCGASDEIMQENVEEKLLKFIGLQPGQQLDEEMPQWTEKPEKIYSLTQEPVGEEEKFPVSEPSGYIAQQEDNELGEQANKEKPQSVRKQKKVSSSGRAPVENEEKVISLQEEFAEKVNKCSLIREELVEKCKEESDENEEDEEMDMDEGGPAMAAGKRTASKRKLGRPRVGQGRRTRATPKPKEDEELCFICFDGGDLVVCDHRSV